MANIPISQFIPYIGGIISMVGIVFQIGKQSEKLETICFEVKALENKDYLSNIFICNVNGKLLIADEKLKNIEEDVREIKIKLNKK